MNLMMFLTWITCLQLWKTWSMRKRMNTPEREKRRKNSMTWREKLSGQALDLELVVQDSLMSRELVIARELRTTEWRERDKDNIWETSKMRKERDIKKLLRKKESICLGIQDLFSEWMKTMTPSEWEEADHANDKRTKTINLLTLTQLTLWYLIQEWMEAIREMSEKEGQLPPQALVLGTSRPTEVRIEWLNQYLIHLREIP